MKQVVLALALLSLVPSSAQAFSPVKSVKEAVHRTHSLIKVAAFAGKAAESLSEAFAKKELDFGDKVVRFQLNLTAEVSKVGAEVAHEAVKGSVDAVTGK